MTNREYVMLEDKNGKEVLPVTDGNGVFVEGGTKKLDKKLTEINEQLEHKASDLIYFEAPIQPSFSKREKGYIWNGDDLGQDEFRKQMIDPLVLTAPNYVKINLLGKDTSNTYDIYEYVFEPYNYTQTILLTAGVHGRETVPVYSLYRFMHYLINEPDIHPYIRYIRDNVRVCIIPVVNPWGGSQLPKVYGNVNDSSITRNVDFEWELCNEAKGDTPFSENEAKILYDWVTKYKNIASFYLDAHTNFSYYGQAPDKDLWVNLTWGDNYLAPIIKRVNSYLKDRINTKYPELEFIDNTDVTTKVLLREYANNYCNIPTATMEWCETRYGNPFAGSADITNHLTHYVNYIGEAVMANIPKIKEFEKNSNFDYYTNNKISYHSLNPIINCAGFSDSLYNFYDSFIDNIQDVKVEKELLGIDTTNTSNLYSYTFTPKNATKSILLYAGGYSASQFKDVFVLQNLINCIYTSNDFVLNEIKNTYKITVIPVINIGCFDFSKETYDRNSSILPKRGDSPDKINGLIYYGEFMSSNLNEVNYIKTLVENNNFNACIAIDRRTGLAVLNSGTKNKLFNILAKNCEYSRIKNNARLTVALNSFIRSDCDYYKDKIFDFVRFEVGTTPFSGGNPLYNCNKIEMKHFTEILINTLYQYKDCENIEFEKPNLLPLFCDGWELHDSSTLSEDLAKLIFTPSGSYQENNYTINAKQSSYLITFNKLPKLDDCVHLYVYGTDDTGQTISTLVNKQTNSGNYTFTVNNQSITNLKISVRSYKGANSFVKTVIDNIVLKEI